MATAVTGLLFGKEGPMALSRPVVEALLDLRSELRAKHTAASAALQKADQDVDDLKRVIKIIGDAQWSSVTQEQG